MCMVRLCFVLEAFPAESESINAGALAKRDVWI